MNDHDLPTPAPTVYPETKDFWDGTSRSELRLQRCDDCDSVVWYPRGICPECSSFSLTSFTASGRGSIYTWTTISRGIAEYRDVGPYVLAYVELEEGPRVMTNIVENKPDDLVIGGAVEAVFQSTPDGAALLRFRPVH